MIKLEDIENPANLPEEIALYRKRQVLMLKRKAWAFANTGRNELCPCYSGIKYKRCCWGKK